MLKRFFFNLLSSFMGAWLALVLFGVVAFFVILGVAVRMGASEGDPISLSKNSVMVLDLKGEIIEAEGPKEFNPMGMFASEESGTVTLSSLVSGLREGAEDKKVAALYIKCGAVSAGASTLRTLRQEIEAFRKKGKKVYAYADTYYQGSYYVASVADSIFLNHGGTVDLHGFGGQTMFLKDFFDKIGVEFEVVKVGTFKSAVEPYIMNHMSEPARAQLDTLYGNMWSVIRSEIAKGRKIPSSRLDLMVSRDYIATQSAEWACTNRLVDRVVYQREMDDIVGRIIDEKGKDVKYVDIASLAAKANWGNDYNSKKSVAVLYASGVIAESDRAGIYCERIVPVIVKLADDEHVKGLVLRVNSPGGSVFGSDQIAEALAYFKSKKKPFAVSMGDYAASGGYWISCDADRIFAGPLTVTGSIGIFGLIPNAEGLASKIGIGFEEVSTNPEADFPSLFKHLTTGQREALQKSVERGYDQFISRVAKGRKMKPAQVRRIAEGRVWDGETALKIGLVDQLGTLYDAIDWVASKAKIKGDHGVAIYPQYEPTMWDRVLEAASQSQMASKVAEVAGPGVDAKVGAAVVDIINRNPVQARMIPVKVGL